MLGEVVRERFRTGHLVLVNSFAILPLLAENAEGESSINESSNDSAVLEGKMTRMFNI